MTLPKAYEPEEGYMYQILGRMAGQREWESIDYAIDRKDLKYLLGEYRLGFGGGWAFQTIPLPKKYHPKKILKP